MSYQSVQTRGINASPGAILFPLEEVVAMPLMNGESFCMIVDGSETPQYFTFDASEDHDIEIYEIRVMFSVDSIIFGANNFGSGSKLTNGFKIEITYGDGANNVVLGNATFNEQLFCFLGLLADPVTADMNHDFMILRLLYGGSPVLVKGSDDCIKATIQDNLTGCGFSCLGAFVIGRKR